MIYDLAAGLGHYTPRSRMVELVLHGQAEGVYMVTEQIKRDTNWVNISKMTEPDISGYEVTGGHIFKFDPILIVPLLELIFTIPWGKCCILKKEIC